MKNLIISTREYREKMLNDPYRPTYHFTHPDDNGFPGDPNGAFFADGVYHLMYLYKNSKTNGFQWGHISSTDLLHWRHHVDALVASDGHEGYFSGGGFIDEDKRAYFTFWKLPAKDKDNGGIAMAYSDPPYEAWYEMEPLAIECNHEKMGIVDIEIEGKIEHVSCADPSNIWKKDGFYYMQTGNLCVLNAYGRGETASEHYQGDWTDLFRSKDLKKWEFVHRFYKNTHAGADWPDHTEDDMCPSFLPLYDAKENGKLTDKYLQLFISHNKGCQYYVGTLCGENFTPECHGRMSWKDSAYFAPEAVIGDKKRHIMWVWLRDNVEKDFDTYGWSGVYSFPRVLWWDGKKLCMAPADELDLLQYNRQVPQIADDNTITVNNGEIFRLKAEINVNNQAGFSIRCDKDGNTHTDIYYDKEAKKLVFDATDSGEFGWKIKEEAPMELDENETLKLDIFADKSVIEVYANEKQAICRRVYPKNPSDAVGVKYIGDKKDVINIETWDIAPANPY